MAGNSGSGDNFDLSDEMKLGMIVECSPDKIWDQPEWDNKASDLALYLNKNKVSFEFAGGESVQRLVVQMNEQSKNKMFTVSFKKESSKKSIVSCVTDEKEDGIVTFPTMWQNIIPKGESVVGYSFRYFNKLVDLFHPALKKIELCGPYEDNHLKTLRLEVASLKVLESLTVHDCDVGIILSIFSKLSKPLKELTIGVMNDRDVLLFHTPSVFNVKESLTIWKLKLTKEKFLKLSAASVAIHIGSLTMEDVIDIIFKWQNGRLRNNVKCFQWDLSESNLDTVELFKTLGFEERNMARKTNKIQHFLIEKLCARIYIEQQSTLVFEVGAEN